MPLPQTTSSTTQRFGVDQKQFDTHFHPEKNIVNGVDVTTLPRSHMQKPAVFMPKVSDLAGQGSSTATCDAQLQRTGSTSSGVDVPAPSTGNMAANVAAAGFTAASTFQPRMSSEKIIKHEFDFK
ncbi:hypothetical protein FSP39_016233 [Pinctada imbricata]|uniref:Uncharacterized protein n=1 Tax=Pinctada imbricata TaxID=66713 RepID=A0AA89BM55_PINIB|nr:hypothetical protein FSP39_016233 [Pinctada imbricata]